MAWYDVFDSEDDNYTGDDGWGITYDGFDDNEYYDTTDLGYWNDSDPWADSYSDQLDADYAAGDTSWYDNLGSEKLGLGGQFNNALNKYAGKGTFAGGLLGGKDGSVTGQDLGTYLGAGIGAYRQDKANDRYNEMMQPMTDLYKSQAADVAQRRANRGTNIASEFDTAMGMMQPSWDRADQRDANLAQHQGVTQSSANAWNKAASEQRRDLTKLYTQQQIEKSYDDRTGVLGGQLSNPWNKEYGQRQQNPYLNMGIQGLMGELN